MVKSDAGADVGIVEFVTAGLGAAVGVLIFGLAAACCSGLCGVLEAGGGGGGDVFDVDAGLSVEEEELLDEVGLGVLVEAGSPEREPHLN